MLNKHYLLRFFGFFIMMKLGFWVGDGFIAPSNEDYYNNKLVEYEDENQVLDYLFHKEKAVFMVLYFAGSGYFDKFMQAIEKASSKYEKE